MLDFCIFLLWAAQASDFSPAIRFDTAGVRSERSPAREIAGRHAAVRLTPSNYICDVYVYVVMCNIELSSAIHIYIHISCIPESIGHIFHLNHVTMSDLVEYCMISCNTMM